MSGDFDHEMPPEEFRAVRLKLGWGAGLMGRALRLGRWWDAEDLGPKTRVRAMEAGRKLITGPMAVAVQAFAAGFRPDHIEWEEDQDADD